MLQAEVTYQIVDEHPTETNEQGNNRKKFKVANITASSVFVMEIVSPHSVQTRGACAVPAIILQRKLQTINVESFSLTAKLNGRFLKT